MWVENENKQFDPKQYSSGESCVRVHQAAEMIAAMCEKLRLSPLELTKAVSYANAKCYLSRRDGSEEK